MPNIKITEEELKEINVLQSDFSQLVTDLGQIQIEKLETELATLKKLV